MTAARGQGIGLAPASIGQLCQIAPDTPVKDTALPASAPATASSRPDDDIAARLRAIAAIIRVKPGEALAEAQAMLRDHPEFPPVWRMAALAARHGGDPAHARDWEAQAIALSLDAPALREARAAIDGGKLEAAEIALRAHLKEDPEDPAAALLLGTVASRCGALPEAERLFGRALLLAPAYAEAGMALAELRRDAGRYHEALAPLDQVLGEAPGHLPAHLLKADLLLQERRLDEADAALVTLLEHHPEATEGWMKYAHLLQTVGRRAEAIAAYRRVVTLDPGKGRGWWMFANMKTVRLDDADIAVMRAELAQPSLAEDQRVPMQFALGKALEDAQQPAAAFAAYAQGARLRLERTPHDPEAVFADVRRMERLFDAEFFAARQGWGCEEADPIFIVSLPRSGSTLVEQILASHPLIEGTEELADIERIALSVGGDPRQPAEYRHWTERIGSLNAREVRELGDHYITAAARYRHTNRPFFTDKMPTNWVYTGFIRLILPRARIIDVRRHPLACGWANFTQHFSWGINYSYDLGHIGHFYAAYVRQMAHFDRVAPGAVHRVFHEDLVADPEATVRALLAALDLPFDPACLRFHENARAVHTPSADQVRRPINRDGLDRWRAYEPWLGPLKAALGPVLEYYPQVPPFDDQKS